MHDFLLKSHRFTLFAEYNHMSTAHSLCLLSVSQTVTLFDPVFPLSEFCNDTVPCMSGVHYPAAVQAVSQPSWCMGVNQAVNLTARLDGLGSHCGPLSGVETTLPSFSFCDTQIPLPFVSLWKL